jgi:uncharacterized protein (TIGR02246 family)
MTKAEEVLALERAALDRWGKGDPSGYLELYEPDVTYFDPAVPKRMDGLKAMEQYYAPVTGKISIDRFEYLNTDVRVHGDMAILTYNLVSHGSTATRWNVTTVYEHSGGEWKIVHSHFSYTERP